MSLDRKIARRRIGPADRRKDFEAIVSELRMTPSIELGASSQPAIFRGRLEEMFRGGLRITQSRAESAAIATAEEWKELWAEFRATEREVAGHA
jgi:hypothetical protein